MNAGTHMNRTRTHRDNAHSDSAKADTPDKHRNEKARWKDHDQLQDRDSPKPDPEQDYPGAHDAVPR
jgi:hypothetical protein